MMWCGSFLLLLSVSVIVITNISSQECQRVLTEFRDVGDTVAPVTYNGIEPDTTDCFFQTDRTFVQCPAGQGVLSDGDIGPTHSVDVSDPDQVTRFFVWHRDNGTVMLEYSVGVGVPFDVSYIDVYTLSVPSARIGSPGTTRFSTLQGDVNTQSCTTNTLSRNIFTVSQTSIASIQVIFEFTNQDIDWLFISEIQLCAGDPPSSISCDPLPTDTTTPTTSPPTTPSPPLITLSYLPPTGVSVTPNLSQPDSVSLTCSVASPPTDDYQYQWQWLKSGTLLTSDTRFTITHTTNSNTQSSSLQISGLRYSDAGEYMCRVNYTLCPDTVGCSEATPVTGNIQLNLPVVLEVKPLGSEFRLEGSDVVLECEVYGYPRDSSPPVWTWSGGDLQSSRFTTSVTNADLLNDASSISSTESVVSQLTISNATEGDSGKYTCSVQGNSSSININIGGSSSEGDKGAMIAGIIVAVLLSLIVLAVAVVIILLMIWRFRRDGKLDVCSCPCSTISCPTCSCLTLCASLKNVQFPFKRRQHSNKNGSLNDTANDAEMQVYSSVQKRPKKAESPPPLPPLTLTETELNDLMSTEDRDIDIVPADEKPSRRNTALSTYSQSGSTPKLVKVTKLKKFKMKENPIYQSADELQLDNKMTKRCDDTLYALPSKASSTRNSSSFTDSSNSDPIYSEAITPSMFTKRSSTMTTDDNLHPFGPVYARPVKLQTRQPLVVSEDNIREIKQIGVGQFGAVILAKMCDLKSSDMKSLSKDAVDENGDVLVAVKRLKPDVSDEVRQSFDKEIKFMSQLQHESIVQLLAVCTQRENPFIVMEYMENGDLNQFVQRYQIVNDDTALYSNQVLPSTLLYMAVQIASGMCYLASLNYVHRDLATRNCLVGSKFRIKISDFGMSRNLYERVYYRVRGRAMLPIRWMATESFYGRFSEKSDVWAYGVTVWEIFTLGKRQPYEELDDQEMIQDAIRGTGRRIMNKPEGCPQAVYEVMLRCWEYAAADRATFKEISDSLISIQKSS